MKSENSRQSLELAHILEQYGNQYCDQYNPCTQQRKALVAITNSRIFEMSEDQVSFRYQDNKDHGVRKTMTLQAVEFIRRFMMHILPDNFYKIRYFGILAAVHTRTIREQCLALIGRMNDLARFVGLSDAEVYRVITGNDSLKCPQCNAGIMITFRNIPLPHR